MNVLQKRSRNAAARASQSSGRQFDPTDFLAIFTFVINLLKDCGKSSDEAQAMLQNEDPVAMFILRRQCLRRFRRDGEVAFAACCIECQQMDRTEFGAAFTEET